MSSSNAVLYLYEAVNEKNPDEPAQVAQVEIDGLDVYFPDHVDGWTDVLDCRVEPYTEKTLRENSIFAHHVHKQYILVSADQVE